MTRLKKVFYKLGQFIPTKLPITTEEMDKLIDDVLSVNDLPNDPSYHHAMAGAIMHLGPITSRKSKRYFAKSVRKSIANQVAFKKIKSLQEEEKKAFEEKFNKEVTITGDTSLDGPELQKA